MWTTTCSITRRTRLGERVGAFAGDPGQMSLRIAVSGGGLAKGSKRIDADPSVPSARERSHRKLLRGGRPRAAPPRDGLAVHAKQGRSAQDVGL